MKEKLSLEETKIFLEDWQKNSNQDSITKIINSYNGLVVYIAKKYYGQGLSFDELVSAGLEGMFKALNAFDTSNPMTGFTSYLYVSIERAIFKELNKYHNYYNHVVSLETKVNSSDSDLTLEDIIQSDDKDLIDDIVEDMKIKKVKKALKCLNKKELQIILLKYGLGDKYIKTSREIAEILDYSLDEVKEIEKKALVKMRHPKNTKILKDFIND